MKAAGAHPVEKFVMWGSACAGLSGPPRPPCGDSPIDSRVAASGDRYLFVTTTYDPASAARYGDTTAAGERSSRDLNARFADWSYLTANGDFQKLRLTKNQLLRYKPLRRFAAKRLYSPQRMR